MIYWEWTEWEERSCEKIEKKGQEHPGKARKGNREKATAKQETRDGSSSTHSINDSGHVSEERQKILTILLHKSQLHLLVLRQIVHWLQQMFSAASKAVCNSDCPEGIQFSLLNECDAFNLRINKHFYLSTFNFCSHDFWFLWGHTLSVHFKLYCIKCKKLSLRFKKCQGQEFPDDISGPFAIV